MQKCLGFGFTLWRRVRTFLRAGEPRHTGLTVDQPRQVKLDNQTFAEVESRRVNSPLAGLAHSTILAQLSTGQTKGIPVWL